MTSKKQKAGTESLRPFVSFKWVASLFLACIFTSIWAIVYFTWPDTTQAQGTSDPFRRVINSFDNNKEYLSGLTLTQDEASSAISLQANRSLSGVLTVSGTMAVGTTNTGNTTSFIGGGSENATHGDNTLILWGKGNTTFAPNGIILWWIANVITGTTPNAFLGGGSGNSIGSGKASFLLGGKNNTNNGGLIMGMENNRIEGGINNLILGAKITIPAAISNAFVWSTVDNFSPATGNAFYANTSGVGINTNAPQVVFDSKGAVKFWSGNNIQCTTENVGLMRSVNWYLCGCTNKGYWENLTETVIDSGSIVCNSDNNACKYAFSGALNRYVFKGTGCSEEIIAGCHIAENGFTYCFPIFFWEREDICNGNGANFPYCFDLFF